MSPSPSPQPACPQPSRPGSAGRLLGALLTGLALLAGSGCSEGAGELHATQDALLAALPGEWQTRIQVTVGPVWLGLARAGVALADVALAEVEPQARAALAAVRGFKVSIHRPVANPPDRAGMLRQADRALAGRGWERVVGVMENHELVAVYAPRDATSPRQLPLCVMVFTGDELILVSARGNVEALVELALNETREERKRGGWLTRHAH